MELLIEFGIVIGLGSWGRIRLLIQYDISVEGEECSYLVQLKISPPYHPNCLQYVLQRDVTDFGIHCSNST